VRYFFIILSIFIFNLDIQAEEIYGRLNGKVVTYNSVGKRLPIVGRKIKIIYNDGRKSVESNKPIDESGDFHLTIDDKEKMILGKKIKITIDSKDYFILSPYNGEMFPPESLKSYQLNIIVISNDSKVQTGSFYANFKNRDRSRANRKQGYTIQVIATRDWTKAVDTEASLKNYNSFKECRNEDNICRVYVSFFQNRKDAISLKNRIKRDFKSKKLYQDIFVRSILH
jgi:hypothetical protein